MKLSKRLRFVAVLTAFGTAYGAILAFRLLGHQADALSDVIKLSLIIFLALIPLSAFWWTVMTSTCRPFDGNVYYSCTDIYRWI